MKHQRKLYYSIENGGDGSAYPVWFDSEELAELHQEFLDEGWGEPCTGWITVESDSPITVVDEIMTIDSYIKETLSDLDDLDDIYPEGSEYHYMVIDLKEKLKRLEEMK